MRLRSETEEEKVQNIAVWRAVRYLFWELQHNSNMKEFIDAEQFLEVYLDQDRKQVVNGVHCYIHEFFMCLVDKLEMHLDAVAAPNFVRHFLKGHAMNLHVCRYGHERWNSDGFYALEVDVKGKKNLVESLVSMLVGSKIGNYECEECCKRFDYQPLTGNRVKINDKFEFPIEEDLDLEPFTWEAMHVREEKLNSMKRFSKADTAITLEKIGRKENLKNLQVPHNDESKEKLRPESYYKNRLQGIINHLGKANAGPYISFVRERDAPHQWYEFNDDRVRLLPSPAIETLKAEAFGGSFLDDTALIDPEILKYKRLSLLSEADTVKPYSAYILIYERKQPVDDWSLERQLLSQIPQAKLKEKTRGSHLPPTISKAIGSFPLFAMHPPPPHTSPLKMRSPFNDDVFADSALTEHSPMKSSFDGMSSVDESVLVRQLGIVRDRQIFSNTFFAFVRRLFEQFGCEQSAEEEEAATAATSTRLSTGASSATTVSSLIKTKLAGKISSSSSSSASASMAIASCGVCAVERGVGADSCPLARLVVQTDQAHHNLVAQRRSKKARRLPFPEAKPEEFNCIYRSEYNDCCGAEQSGVEDIACAPSIVKSFLLRCEDTQLCLCFFRVPLCALSAVLKSVTVYLSKADASQSQQHLSILLQQLFYLFTSLLDLLPAKQKKAIQFVPLFAFLRDACFLSPVCSWLLLLANYTRRCQDFLSPSLSKQSGKCTFAAKSLYFLAPLDVNSACQDELPPVPREAAMALLTSLISFLYNAPSPPASASLSILMILKGTNPTPLFASDSSFFTISLPSIPISQEDAFNSIISQSF
ncbi:putative ubiquitin domain containing protein [Monocercomonoides exilis]|uniref:putative ubiquitin domain containing protein n=1 Tax=Monocercomonoides exilis TaxID=2049356 RepID=UPI003559547A|nr:putative ubiquitin domain containing protein [Monocercomonoides exilis]|eukprot:MONOS_9609.1-p1 / transcript=MONOS_9609.1 / gene=MONOS_9609 / organism=Monocercomonoides_exilis_PA203 / gene_product=ubiquitin domain containing protein / transcript_product=ubiquitin domain containing protein / location=Mono_scaffold00402:37739-40356(-) / protein_length=816 / sequence_SO=supercontig / SO=protein_coding / is_pseudo=false